MDMERKELGSDSDLGLKYLDLDLMSLDLGLDWNRLDFTTLHHWAAATVCIHDDRQNVSLINIQEL